ncbi:phosphatidylserine decarboxylase family protein [Crepidotus variabilis]|uniref:Phosphatidylserine decarboxylase family protein n=1 Tax=Crepidotus variabilis TaxID=179855 RepID=A0A9P6E6Z2_9AGAR|nr:phosphatidylserine decarboxylase family protein [Crepidotus variabilis]
MPLLQYFSDWLPIKPAFYTAWLDRVSVRTEDDKANFHPAIREFKRLIERDPTLFMLFTSMFDEIPTYPPYHYDPAGDPQIRDHLEMLKVLDRVIQRAPPWSDQAWSLGIPGVPINTALKWPMATVSGRAVFLEPRVNVMFKKLLDVWAQHLSSPASLGVLNDQPDGWLSPNALSAMTKKANIDNVEGITFADIYICDPTRSFWGFKSWDDFFTRKFKDGLRPVAEPSNDTIIVNPCECVPYRVQSNVSKRDKFWVKAQPYSIDDILGFDSLGSRFVGGSIYQAFLGPLIYHRWHSPVTGMVKKTYKIPGTYYSQKASASFLGEPDPLAPTQSQAYETAVATRAVIAIQADNPDIGMVIVLPVGMSEVSSCEVTVSANQRVTKGQEIGMFHYGGSTVCLIFEKGVVVEWEKRCLPPYPEDQPSIGISRKIASVSLPRIAEIEDRSKQ